MSLTNWLNGFSQNCSRTLRQRPCKRRQRGFVSPVTAEVLEIRQFPAATLTATLSTTGTTKGTLTIEGTNGDDNIVVRQISNQISVAGIQISKAGVLSNSVAASQVTKIVVNGLEGNDAINLNSGAVSGQQAIAKPSTLNGGDGTDVLIGGNGADSILGGDKNDTLTGGLGNDTLDGGDGTNRLEESADVKNLTLTNSKLTGIGTDTMIAIQQAVLIGGASNNTINASTFSGPVTLIGGAGNDKLDGGIGDDNLLDGGRGKDTLYGSTDFDTIQDEHGVLHVTGTNCGDMITIAQNDGYVLLRGHENKDLTHKWAYKASFSDNYIIRVEVNGLGGADTITNISEVAMTARGGDGDDTLTGSNPGDDLYGEGGNDMLDGSRNFDIVGFDGGVLYLYGTAGNDEITVAQNDGYIIIREHGVDLTRKWAYVPSFADDYVRQINVFGYGGTDTITNITTAFQSETRVGGTHGFVILEPTGPSYLPPPSFGHPGPDYD